MSARAERRYFRDACGERDFRNACGKGSAPSIVVWVAPERSSRAEQP
jgi:hypothetical protein